MSRASRQNGRVGTADIAALANVADALSLRRLADLGAAQAARSVSLSQQREADAYSLIETWTNLSNWTTTGGGLSVSGNQLYGNGTASWAVLDGLTIGQRAVMTAEVVVPAASGTGAVLIGFTRAASGVGTTGDLWGLLLDAPGGKSWDWFNNSRNANNFPTSTQTVAAGTYKVTITVDEIGTAYSLTKADGTVITTQYHSRTGTTGSAVPNRFIIFSDDNRGSSGIKVGKVSVRGDSVTPRKGGTVSGPEVSWRFDTSAADQGIMLALPDTYDARVPVPLVVHHHGYNTGTFVELNPLSETPNVMKALLTAGYAVLSVRGGVVPNQNSWGATSGLTYTKRALDFVTSRYAIGPVVLWGNSMGGIVTLNLLTDRTVPNIVAWYGQQPVCNLQNMYDAGTYAAAIRTAYGIASDGSDYAAKTAGRDPVLRDASAFRGVPMRFVASPGDGTVSKAQNADRLAAKVAGYSPVSVLAVTGDHNDPSHFIGSDMVTFYNGVLGR